MALSSINGRHDYKFFDTPSDNMKCKICYLEICDYLLVSMWCGHVITRNWTSLNVLLGIQNVLQYNIVKPYVVGNISFALYNVIQAIHQWQFNLVKATWNYSCNLPFVNREYCTSLPCIDSLILMETVLSSHFDKEMDTVNVTSALRNVSCESQST